MPITAITDPPARLTDAVHSRLREAILTGDPAPGQQLSVPALAKVLNVSRGSVREAVLQLVADGLAEERPRRGVVVITLGHEELRHIHRIRESLDGLAARLCAEHSSSTLCDQLRVTLNAVGAATSCNDGAGYVEIDAAFHAQIADACGNPMLAALIERLHDQMRVALVPIAEHHTHRHPGLEELQRVLDAIADGDPDAAETAMRVHIRRTRELLDGENRASGR